MAKNFARNKCKHKIIKCLNKRSQESKLIVVVRRQKIKKASSSYDPIWTNPSKATY